MQHDRCYIHDGTTPIETVYKDPFTSEHVEKIFARSVGIAEITGDVIAEIDGQNDFVYYGVNHRGDTVATYDTGGSLTCQIWYDAFGNIVQSTPSADLPFYTFSTKEYLADVNLYLFQYRVYDPVAGRWTQRDPVDYQDSENLYQFCGNNPVNGIDEYGLRDWTWPLNGKVTKNKSKNTVTVVDGDNRKVSEIKPGESSEKVHIVFLIAPLPYFAAKLFIEDDIDFIKIKGVWYDVSPFGTSVNENGDDAGLRNKVPTNKELSEKVAEYREKGKHKQANKIQNDWTQERLNALVEIKTKKKEE